MDENFYMDAPDEMVEYLTKHAEGSVDKLEASYEITRQGAEKLMHLLIAGIGGAALLLFNQAGAGIVAWSAAGLVAIMAGWFGCALYLLKTCIAARKRLFRFFNTRSLYFEDARTPGEKVTLHTLKRLQIFDMENLADDLQKINFDRAKSLDLARYISAGVALSGVCVSALFFAVHRGIL